MNCDTHDHRWQYDAEISWPETERFRCAVCGAVGWRNRKRYCRGRIPIRAYADQALARSRFRVLTARPQLECDGRVEPKQGAE